METLTPAPKPPPPATGGSAPNRHQPGGARLLARGAHGPHLDPRAWCRRRGVAGRAVRAAGSSTWQSRSWRVEEARPRLAGSSRELVAAEPRGEAARRSSSGAWCRRGWSPRQGGPPEPRRREEGAASSRAKLRGGGRAPPRWMPRPRPGGCRAHAAVSRGGRCARPPLGAGRRGLAGPWRARAGGRTWPHEDDRRGRGQSHEPVASDRAGAARYALAEERRGGCAARGHARPGR